MDIDPTNVPMNTFPAISFPADSLNTLNPSSLDQNSPILFKRNMELVQRELVTVQSLAQGVLAGINGAYSVGIEPMNTKRLITDLKQSLDNLTSLLRQTGVGALPLLPPPPPPSSAFSDVHHQHHGQHHDLPAIPTEEELLRYANESVKTLYDSLKRKQESAAVVANLLQQVGGVQGGYVGGMRQGGR